MMNILQSNNKSTATGIQPIFFSIIERFKKLTIEISDVESSLNSKLSNILPFEETLEKNMDMPSPEAISISFIDELNEIYYRLESISNRLSRDLTHLNKIT